MAALAAIVLFAVWRPSTTAQDQSSFRPFTQTPSSCSSQGCAAADLLVQGVDTVQYHGSSCTGTHGSWFLNAISRGGDAPVHPSYALHFSLVGSSTARPTGTIIVPQSAPNHVAIALTDGLMTIVGTTAAGKRVTAQGLTTVRLDTDSAGSLRLTVIVTGVTAAEKELGVFDPFNIGGRPAIVPVKTVAQMSGC